MLMLPPSPGAPAAPMPEPLKLPERPGMPAPE
jgi:hypothetical protein